MRPAIVLSVLPFVMLAVAGREAQAQGEPPRDVNVVLRVSVVGGERPFRIGELIPLELSFSTAVADRYQINMATYDRGGRMEFERFVVSPSNGAVDPLANSRGPMGGGLTSFKYLTTDPWSIQLNLNEWVRFTQPGTYRLAISSRRVDIKDPATVRGSSPVLSIADPITLTIIPATAAWQKATLDGAVAVLNRPAPSGPSTDAQYRDRVHALNTLRFLGTPEAIKGLVNCLRDDPFGNRTGTCVLGLTSAADPAVARAALEAALIDPDHPIESGFLHALQAVGTDPAQWQQNQQRALEGLVAALPRKRGPALSISLATAANEVWNFVPLAASTTDALVQQLVARFDELPAEQQSALLETRWDKLATPSLLPILRRHALAFDPISAMNGETRRLAAIALRRWYALDPAGARPAILAEITRPQPRFDARVLGMLPDKTLPEVDSALAKNFAAIEGATGRIAALIARYATGAILTPVLVQLDPLLGRSACELAPILAYVLRVDPRLARPRIERALSARGSTGCYRELLPSIANLHYDPVLEDIALQHVADPDPRVRVTSASMLARFGSPRAEAVISERYTSWSKTWLGRETELTPTFADSRERQEAINEGHFLLLALITGQSWLTDASKLKMLLAITPGERLRQTLEGALRTWNNPPFTITVNDVPASAGLDAHVVQYDLPSMDALKSKLAQFPTGTAFAIQWSARQSPGNPDSEAALTQFLRDRGMVVVAPRLQP